MEENSMKYLSLLDHHTEFTFIPFDSYKKDDYQHGVERYPISRLHPGNEMHVLDSNLYCILDSDLHSCPRE